MVEEVSPMVSAPLEKFIRVCVLDVVAPGTKRGLRPVILISLNRRTLFSLHKVDREGV